MERTNFFDVDAPLPCYTCTSDGVAWRGGAGRGRGRHVAASPDSAAKKRVELFLRSLAPFSLGRSVDVVKNDVYDVMQPRREREATMEECERPGGRRREGGRKWGLESRWKAERGEEGA